MQVFVGENGSGKTNILEAISVLSLTKSFLGVDDGDVMQWGAEFYRVTGKVRTDEGEEKDLQVVSQILPRKQKACFRNDVRTTLSHMVGSLPIITFLPQDLSLFSGPPAERRRFLDQILCQVSPEYFLTLLEYQKLLKQRNALLRSIREGSAQREDLVPWDSALADKASFLTLLRLELMETFSLTLASEVQALGETWTDVAVRYIHTGEARTRSELTTEFIAALQASLERDLILETTGIGPHRDDWECMVGPHSLKTFASRGQQRVAVLSLLFLEASYLEVRRGEKPVILLDDIFSELDDNHRGRVTSAFQDHQVFMTSTHVPPGTENAQVWEIEKGKVRVKEKVVVS
jgi:DNA replication and repair protein RecF